VFAEHQKKGRGRLGRAWISPKGSSILFSYLLRPALSPSQISRVTLVAGVSIARACRKITGKSVGIKWPNDIYYENKKVGGILTEMSAESDRINFVVVGVGLNINAPLSELPPGSLSLSDVLGHKIPRVLFSQFLLREIEADYLRLKKGFFEEISREWENYSLTTGRRVVATLLDRRIEGQATGIDTDGALWIRKDNGLQERILSGDIQHLRASL
jgi:BirA family biotin operon repressor/biotin-[acetyl-CoA-carboxylase] ligase